MALLWSRTMSTLLAVVNALLNSQVLDQIFRCMSGSVAVSAYELNALPLPGPNMLDQLGQLIASGAPSEDIEEHIAELYGLR
jgi:adenine-specific DNA-methyltransferase